MRCGSTSPSSRSLQAPRQPHAPERSATALLDPQPVQQALVPAPPAPHAHRELEVHAAAQLALELLARGRADRLDHPPPGADQDALLRLGLDPAEGAGDRDPPPGVDSPE